MILEEQIFARTALLTGQLEGTRAELMKALCAAASASLAARLREGLTPQDCAGDFITAASLMALADLTAAEENGQIQEFQAGDLRLRQGSGGESRTRDLRQRAESLMGPYLKDRFAFLGV